MILGLDISTSITGWCLLEKSGKFHSMGFVDLKKQKGMFLKSIRVKEFLDEISKNIQIDKVFIEENLQSFRSGFSSAQTLSTLARFNGVVSYLCFDKFKTEPFFLNVNSSRKKLGIKVEREKVCGISTKQQVLNWASMSLPDYEWPTKKLKSGPRKGQVVLEQGCYDMADAYVIALAGSM